MGILSHSEQRNSVKQVAGDGMVYKKSGLPAGHAAIVRIVQRQRAARSDHVGRRYAKIVIGKFVSDELSTRAETEVGLARHRCGKADIRIEDSRLMGIADVVEHVEMDRQRIVRI